MAEFDPDAFIKKYGDDQDQPSEKPVTGSPIAQTVVGAGRGFVKGLEEATDAAASYRPGSYTYAHGVPKIPPSQSGAEAVGRFGGNIAPSLLIGPTGIGAAAEGLAARGLFRGGIAGLPNALRAGRLAKAGTEGALGGATAPRDEDSHNIAVGAAAGTGLQVTKELIAATPPRYRVLFSLLPGALAVEVLHKMGMLNAWTSYPVVAGIGAGLGEMAARALTRVPAAAAGNVSARIRPAQDENDGR
jgi:hypothetical protein